jgi:N-methylhydantoinase A
MGKYRVSADIGGTFTDFVFFDVASRKFSAAKTLTTPQNLSDAIISGIGEEIEDFSDIEFFVHGTTSGLNAVLERKGAKVALITTKGFHDVYEIARGNRNELYNMKFRKTKPLLPRDAVYEVDERILYDGTVEKELLVSEVGRVAGEIAKGAYDSVAVCLINAYRNPVHEEIIQRELQDLFPQKPISLSHKVAREWREYERTSTVVLNAYIAPIVTKYLTILEERMEEKNFKNPVYIMQSGGGVITAGVAKDTPIQTVLSGPVGGAIGNHALSGLLGYPNLIGVDMGGTSYDVSMIVDGKPDVSTETDLEGFPVLMPMVNIYTIGAGGGSIAWIESGGLRVGPVSAGSVPGPACYGNGGTKPTITDANVVLGRIDPQGFLGGRMVLDKDAAIAAVKTIADELKLTVEETADGICKIADAKMADAIRQLTVRKGIDPRQFVLVAYGGAGPMQACSTAIELGIGTVLVPQMPGTFSAWGMHQSDIRQDTVRTYTVAVHEAEQAVLADLFAEMEEEVSAILKEQQIDAENTGYLFSADLRYIGQDHSMNVAFAGKDFSAEALKAARDDFDRLHHSIHGHSNPSEGVEMVNIRLTGLGKLEKVQPEKTDRLTDVKPEATKLSEVIFDSKVYETGIYDRASLLQGMNFPGPAIIEELTTTTIVPPQFSITVDAYANLLIQLNK